MSPGGALPGSILGPGEGHHLKMPPRQDVAAEEEAEGRFYRQWQGDGGGRPQEEASPTGLHGARPVALRAAQRLLVVVSAGGGLGRRAAGVAAAVRLVVAAVCQIHGVGRHGLSRLGLLAPEEAHGPMRRASGAL